jgi:hypothetical protein
VRVPTLTQTHHRSSFVLPFSLVFMSSVSSPFLASLPMDAQSTQMSRSMSFSRQCSRASHSRANLIHGVPDTYNRYIVPGFLEKNGDTLTEDLLDLLRTSDSNFMKLLYVHHCRYDLLNCITLLLASVWCVFSSIAVFSMSFVCIQRSSPLP